MYLEYLMFGLEIGNRKLDLPVDSTWADKGGIETLYLICRHDHLDFGVSVETVELVQELEHCPLDLLLAAGVGVVSLSSDCVDLVDEDY
jgi:hypothetical protein